MIDINLTCLFIQVLTSSLLNGRFITNAQAAPFFTYTPQVKSIGLYLGGQIWQSEVSGILGEQNLLIDFDLIKEQQTNYFIAVEHHFPCSLMHVFQVLLLIQ